MALYAKTATNTFAPCPEGTYQATLTEIVDLGLQQSVGFDAKPRLRLVYEVEETNPKTGKPYRVSEFVTNSLFKNKHKTSKLRERVETLLGRDLTAKEVEPEGFDLETLLGTEATLTIYHKESEDGKIWARVKNVERVPF